MTTRAATLLLVLLASGCTKLFDTATLDPLASAEGYCRARYDAHYVYSVRCWGYDPGWAQIRPRFWYQADCARAAEAVMAGRMTYDREAGEVCLAAYQGLSCEEPQYTLAACAAALAPAVLQGGECTRDAECVGPGTCTSPDGTCPGHCTGFGALGAACDAAHGTCGPGLWCDATATCAPRLASGEACSGNCLENLACDWGVCSYVAGPGEACGALACDPAQPIYCTGGLCLPVPGYGEPCGDGGRCGAGLYCNSGDGFCYRRPTEPQANDQPCAAPAFCAPVSYCDTSLPTPACKARKVAAEPCRTDGECLPPTHCAMTGPPLTWVCRLPPRPGDPCVPGGCATGGWCHVESGATGVCQTEADNGQPCGQIGTGDYASCALGYCALPTPTATTGVCQATRQAGAPCTINYECDSYACDPVAKRCRAPTCPY